MGGGGGVVRETLLWPSILYILKERQYTGSTETGDAGDRFCTLSIQTSVKSSDFLERFVYNSTADTKTWPVYSLLDPLFCNIIKFLKGLLLKFLNLNNYLSCQ